MANNTALNGLETRLWTAADELRANSKLIAFALDLNAEDQRHIAERLSEEELAVFDLIRPPVGQLTKQERETVKAVARELLETLKREQLVLDWRKYQRSRAAVRLTIERTLDQLPPSYTIDVWQTTCDTVYQHIYDKYYGAGRSVYALAA